MKIGKLFTATPEKKVLKMVENSTFKKATIAEKKYLTQKIIDSQNPAIMDKWGAEELVDSVNKNHNVIVGILKKRPGLFWINDKETVNARTQIADFLTKKKQPQLAKDLLSYDEENRGALIIDNPSVKSFLDGLKEPLTNKRFASGLAKLLNKLDV